MSARAALTPLLSTYNISLSEAGGRVQFVGKDITNYQTIIKADFVSTDGPDLQILHEDPERKLKDVRLHFIDVGNDYQLGMAAAREHTAQTVTVEDMRVPIVMDRPFAKYLTERRLADHHAAMTQINFRLPPKFESQLNVGDYLQIEDPDIWQITQIDAGKILDISASRVNPDTTIAISGGNPQTPKNPFWISMPSALGFDLPGDYNGPLVGSVMSPFQPHDVKLADQTSRTTAPLWIGALTTDLPSGPQGRWDNVNSFEFFMPDAILSALPDENVLSGENRFAIETETGWEVIQCADLSLIAPNTYRAARLLRGIDGSDADGMVTIPSGARIIFLDQGLNDVSLPNDYIGEIIDITAQVGDRVSVPTDLIYAARYLRPLTPVHVTCALGESSYDLRWIRRSRVDADSWAGEDIPLGETIEQYRVIYTDQSGDAQTMIVTTPAASVPIIAQGDVYISQYSSQYGYGAQAIFTLPAIN